MNVVRRSGLLLGLLGLATACWGEEIQVSAEKLDFGKIPIGAVQTKVVQISNPTESEIHIAKINSSCGCAQARVAQQAIASGEKIDLVVSARPSKVGASQGAIFVYTSGPRIVISVQVQGFQPLEIEPKYVQFGDVIQGETPSKSFELKLPRPLAATKFTLEFEDKLFKVTQPKADLPTAVKIQLREKASVGLFRESLVLRFNNGEAAVVALYGQVQPAIKVTPASLVFVGVTPGSTVTQTLQIQHEGKTQKDTAPIEVLSHLPDGISLTTKQLSSNEVQLRLTSPENPVNRRETGWLIVISNGKQAKLPVHVLYKIK